MPETFNPVTLTNNTGQPLNASYFNRLETGVESLDDRAAALELGIHVPIEVSFATSVTLNATQGALFRCTASGDLTLDAIVGGTDGQAIVFEVTAQGGARTLDFTADIPSVVIPSGSIWSGTFRYHDAGSVWDLQTEHGGIYLANVSSPPSTPAGGGVIYVQSGSLKFKGSSGTVTTLGPA